MKWKTLRKLFVVKIPRGLMKLQGMIKKKTNIIIIIIIGVLWQLRKNSKKF